MQNKDKGKQFNHKLIEEIDRYDFLIGCDIGVHSTCMYVCTLIVSRVTRLGEFSPFGWLFTLGRL
jgi:hypothetical protein